LSLLVISAEAAGVFALRIILLVVGVVACSTAALMIKASQADPLLIAAWRLLIASAVLGPLFLAGRRRYPALRLRELLRSAAPAGALLALHFWSWNIGVHQTTIANASLIVNMVAPVMPVIVWFAAREQFHPRELMGTAIAFAGTIILAAADLSLEPEYFLGDLMCFGSMLAFAFYLAWSRRHRQLPSLWLSVVPVYLIAGLLCLLGGCLKTSTPAPTEGREWLLFVGLALIPTITGHSILNHAMKQLRSQVVAVVNLGQFISAALLAWLIFHEVPGLQFVVASVLAVGGALFVVREQLKLSATTAPATAPAPLRATGRLG